VRRTAESRDDGFTLIELLVTMVLFGIIIGIAVAPYRNYQLSQAHTGSMRKLVGVMRNLQVRAVAEDATYRISFAADGKSWTTARLSGVSTWTTVATGKPTEKIVVVRNAQFRQSDGSLAAVAIFYPRGSATKGSLEVGRTDRAKVYTVTLEGLTARVSYV
jgi:prepilin-type N-terminal cleavage/methylation domain-containing protein